MDSKITSDTTESKIQNPKSKLVLVFPFELADGATNMALDEALLDTVARGSEVALLRTYGWSVPTLSLGYFQHLEEAQADPRWRSVPTVRRLSGGGAGLGISALPSIAKTNSMGGFSTLSLLGPTTVAGRPSPPRNATYCLPPTS